MLKSKRIPLEFQNNPQKYKKYFKIKTETTVKFCQKTKGDILISQEIKYMPVKQLVSVLKIVKPGIKKINKKARLYLKLWPNTILTRKPKDIRMGRGKGAPTDRVAEAGKSIIFSIHKTMSPLQVKKLMKRCTPKIHKSKFLQTSQW